MASYKYREFVKFCETGKTQRYGSLVMKGNEVFSYRLKIAEVDRTNKRIKYLANPRVSKTTSMHIGSCSMGIRYLNVGWEAIEVEKF